MNRFEHLDNFMQAAAKVISQNLKHFLAKDSVLYALTLSPVAMSLEELLPSKLAKSHVYPILIRTALTISTVVVGLAVPFFGLLLALIGSLLTMLVTLILPCVCFLRILKGKTSSLQVTICALIIIIGTISAVIGSYSSLSNIIQSMS
ncbi:unnamed protein product [Withania somnifera]